KSARLLVSTRRQLRPGHAARTRHRREGFASGRGATLARMGGRPRCVPPALVGQTVGSRPDRFADRSGVGNTLDRLAVATAGPELVAALAEPVAAKQQTSRSRAPGSGTVVGSIEGDPRFALRRGG